MDEFGQRIGDYPTKPFDPAGLAAQCFISQPAAFLRRWAYEQVGMMDARLGYTFDYDLWIRIAMTYPMLNVECRLAASRMHRRSKSLGSREKVFKETIRVLRQHYRYAPFPWVHSYCSYIVDGRDQFFEPLRPSFLKYAMSLPVGLYFNRDHPLRYCREWVTVMSLRGFRRRLAASFGPARPEVEAPWERRSAAAAQNQP